jgi:hypothetical protein
VATGADDAGAVPAAGNGCPTTLELDTAEVDTPAGAPTGADGAEDAAETTGAVEPATGGTTRNTCPTSNRLGFSNWFQRARSRQFWPVSSPMRMSESPGRTV